MHRHEINQILDACAHYFRADGFEVPARGRIYRPLGHHVLGWVGLASTSDRDALEVWPNVGVHEVCVMKMVSALQGRKYVKGDVATYAVSLGEVVPKSTPFKFFGGEDHAAQAMRLVETVVVHGLPWMEKAGSLDLIQLLKQREKVLGGVPERIAVALYLHHRMSEVLDYLKDRQDRYDKDAANPEVAESWKRFSDALLRQEPRASDR